MRTEEQKQKKREQDAERLRNRNTEHPGYYAEQQRKWRAEHPGYNNKATKKWRAQNPERTVAIARQGHLKATYGITLEEYEDILKNQDGVCAICGHIDSRGRNLSVDHDHETGQFRGLLCMNCNRVLGSIKDDVNLLAKMVEYLTNVE